MTRYTAATEGDIFDNWFDLIEADPRTGERFNRADDRTGIGDRFVTATRWAAAWQDGRPHQLTPPPSTTYAPRDASVPKRTIAGSKMRDERRSRHENSLAQVKQAVRGSSH